MNILGVYAEDYPWDVRVDKIFGDLDKSGHNVSLLCRNLNLNSKYEVVNGVNCIRVLPPYYSNFQQSLLTLPAFFNPIWKLAIREEIKKNNIDLIIVRDLPLSILAYTESKKANVPCIIDMAENHPEMWRQVYLNNNKIKSFISKNYYLAKCMESYIAKSEATIFVVVEEMRDHLLSLGANIKNIHILSNTPKINNNEEFIVKERSSDYLNFIYTGYVTKRRGISKFIKVISNLKNMKPLPRLHVVGNGDYLDELILLSKKLKCSDQVVFHGWVNHDNINSLISNCDVGVIPHPKNGHTDNTVPNKLFDYMLAGKPVLVSNALPLERIVTTLNCGKTFVDNNQDSLISAIMFFLDYDMSLEMGLNGFNAIKSKYNWNKDFDYFLSVVNSLGKSTG